jgi:hypothetical protein
MTRLLRTNCLLVRSRLRISWVCASGTKLAWIRPWANSSASHIALLTSVLRPGSFFTCAAFAKTNPIIQGDARSPPSPHAYEAGRYVLSMRWGGRGPLKAETGVRFP